jgi:hypothetical protein
MDVFDLARPPLFTGEPFHVELKHRLMLLCPRHRLWVDGCDRCARRSRAAVAHLTLIIGLYRVELEACIRSGDGATYLVRWVCYQAFMASLRGGS